MARTLNGNLTGSAAHGYDELTDNWMLEQSDQDKRIARLKTRLRFLVGEDNFYKLYVGMPMNGDRLEKELKAKLVIFGEVSAQEYLAAHNICTLAPAMRVCKACNFHPKRIGIDA